MYSPETKQRDFVLTIPFAPGGVVDAMGRGLAEAARPHLPAPLRLQYRPGDDGTVGIVEVLRAPPDGRTLGLAAVAILAVQPHLRKLPYRSPADCAPIIRIASIPTVLVVRQDASWPSLAALLEEARARPGRLRLGLPGIGRISHLNVAQLLHLAGARVTEVVFEGPQQLDGLLQGQVDLAVANQNAVLRGVRAGHLRVLLVFHTRRSPLFPSAPSARECGYDLTLGPYHFMLAPRETPAEVIQTLHEAFRAALTAPSFAAVASEQGFTIDYQGPEALAADLAELFERYGRLVRMLGLSGAAGIQKGSSMTPQHLESRREAR
ncbi:MAG: tripartite tricarboxylate transporter substrate binding protein [Armatimonadota bacterium]|nr:tripartite tricarboxylate transporter substrate binding protein [Armatimonadota bacterium]MDR7427264.1 tripartite tricarboxylate transporter substrate binding protein [Armatimonadota bacterium]MDR7463162.1 tripartite tricarboxylate transporter substrate binding protein [Armatimonadota bacterium]MDR7468851.1 tripartite tricarboxylate transporter substrate binding protein [Armatimonadota bacterium]MDR7475407.1 tripartite tricarboxylate transporter substrate binding protein [Armatimonadota bact